MITPLFVAYISTSALMLGQVPNGSPSALESLSSTLRPIVMQNVPTPLYEKSINWGHTTPAADGVHWQGIKPRVTKSPRNDGTWRKIRLDANGLPDSLLLVLSDLKSVSEDTQRFKANVSMPLRVEFEEQLWESGVRLYSGSTRARLTFHATLDCEYVLRMEKGTTSFLPDTFFRFHVLSAKVSYDEMVVEHMAGVGGSTAKLMGQAVRDMLNQWRPSLERNLLAKAEAAVVKAADTKEVRLSFTNLLKMK